MAFKRKRGGSRRSFRRSRRSRVSRRTGFRRRGRAGRISKWKRRGVNQPDATYLKLRYNLPVDNQPAFTAGIVTLIDQFSGNSIWDPLFTGTGETVDGYTWAQTMYHQYVVMGSSIKVDFCSAAGCPIVVGLIPTPTSSDFATMGTINQILAQPYCKWTTLGLAGSNRGIKTFKAYMSTKKMVAIPGITSDPTYYSVFGTNPSTQWVWNLFCVSPLNIAVNTLFTTVKMTYYTKLFGRKNLTT